MEAPVFVTREPELERLAALLQRALAGQGQVCFLVGEAGSGKTALASEFARRALEQSPDLVVAIGQGDAQTGAGDPYLPFREILGQLTGEAGGHLAGSRLAEENASRLRKLLQLAGQALAEVGPDLLGIFVPGAGLVARLGAFLAGKAGWLEKLDQLAARSQDLQGPAGAGIEQSHIFEQYTNVLNALAAKKPLLLILDDLQWADAGSIDLLFRLGRRIGQSPILIVGTYRPAEVALGRAGERHPLEKALAEFKRYYGDIVVDLDQDREAEGRGFVDALLDSEANRLDEPFRQALHQHTGGHPLFTIELLRALQERGDLVQDEMGRWIEGPVLDWGRLPVRVEGVIEERIGRLQEELRQALTVASVEGVDFTAEVAARVLGVDARDLIQRLGRELEKLHRLVIAQGIRRLGPQRLSLYGFRHSLFQKYVYNGLDKVERALLHEDVGTVLEDLYDDLADEIAVQLAWHFGEAGLTEKARTYLYKAGQQAAARFAHAEALAHFGQALALTPEQDLAARYAILLAREKTYDIQGAREAQARDLADLEKLAEAWPDNRRRIEVAQRWANYAELTGDYEGTITAAQKAIALIEAGRAAEPELSHLLVASYLHWGRACLRQGKHQAAHTRLEQALALARSAQLRYEEGACLHSLGMVSFYEGNYDSARTYSQQALGIHREIGHRRGESMALNNLGNVAWNEGNYDEARAYLEQALCIQREMGNRGGEGDALGGLGSIAGLQGDFVSAKIYLEQVLVIKQEVGDRWGVAATLNNLGNTATGMGDYAEARSYYEQSLHLFRQIGNRGGESMALSNLGDICARLGDYARGRAHAEQSAAIAREIGDLAGLGYGLVFLGLLEGHLGEETAALESCREALHAAEEVGETSLQATALTFLGHTLSRLGRQEEAATAYQQSLALRKELTQPHLAAEALAGLARVALTQGDLSQALSWVEEILTSLQDGTLVGAHEPFLVYLTCYRVLQAVQDPRARSFLVTTHSLLQEQATRLKDEEMRRTYLKEVPAHREIMEAFARREVVH